MRMSVGRLAGLALFLVLARSAECAEPVATEPRVVRTLEAFIEDAEAGRVQRVTLDRHGGSFIVVAEFEDGVAEYIVDGIFRITQDPLLLEFLKRHGIPSTVGFVPMSRWSTDDAGLLDWLWLPLVFVGVPFLVLLVVGLLILRRLNRLRITVDLVRRHLP